MKKNRKKTLTSKTVRGTVFTCILLGFTALIIGLVTYCTTLAGQYVRHSYETAKHASFSAIHGTDSLGLTRQVMEIYHSLTPEQRALMGTPEYRELFSSVDTTRKSGNTWDVLVHILSNYVVDVDDVYVGMYDDENDVFVFVADTVGETSLYPGEWESVTQNEIDTFLAEGEQKRYIIENNPKYGWLCTAGYPMRTEDGEIFAVLLVDVTLNIITNEVLAFLVNILLGIAVVTLAVAWAASKRIKLALAYPIARISDAAMAYVKAKEEGREATSFANLDIHTGDELEDLSHVMAGMEESLAANEDRIRKITAEKERIHTEMDLAGRIQAAMLPGTFPPFPDRKEFDIYASMDPAREVGGDFYDFLMVDSDHLCLVMADVSGKGVPGALFMMISTTILRSCAMLGVGAGQILQKMNDALCSNNQAQMFVTVWVGILEISTGKMTCANAGHEYPTLYSPKRGTFELLKDKHGLVIGAMKEAKYREYTLQLDAGDKIFVYTDGVPEATDERMQMFGTDRMLKALDRAAEGDPKQVLDSVKAAVDDFVGSAEQFDDMTMLCLRYNGPDKRPAEGGSESEGN